MHDANRAVKKHFLRAGPDYTQRTRRWFQLAFLALNVWIGVQFYLFVRYYETGGEFKPLSPQRARSFCRLRAHGPDIAVDPGILSELRYGILILPREGKRAALERWFDSGAGCLRSLPWDADTGLRWAELLAVFAQPGKPCRSRDSLIAVTAAVHGLAMVARNRTNFVNAGVPIVDPFVF